MTTNQTDNAVREYKGWQYIHEHHADLIRSDGLMCEQHPGLEFDHDGCAGPGMPWIIEGKEAIITYGSQQREAGRRDAAEECDRRAKAYHNVDAVTEHEAEQCAAAIRALPPYGGK